jgi:hypothetical protein
MIINTININNILFIESIARMIFCPHTSLKMCSNTHLFIINSASARIFASSENKISIRAKALKLLEIL